MLTRATDATVTVHFADLLPDTVVATMSAVPLFTAVTRPFASTVAACALVVDHVTFLLVAFAGATTAFT